MLTSALCPVVWLLLHQGWKKYVVSSSCAQPLPDQCDKDRGATTLRVMTTIVLEGEKMESQLDVGREEMRGWTDQSEKMRQRTEGSTEGEE